MAVLKRRTLWLVVAMAVFALGLAACGGSDPTPTPPQPTPTTPGTGATPTPGNGAADLECEEEEFGPIIGCANFYEDYWPVIDQSIEDFWAAAQANGETELVVWGFSELAPEVRDQIRTRFPGITVSSRGLQFGTSAAIITAVQANSRTTDTFGGAYTIYMPVWDEGLFDQTIDWTQYGVPAEYLEDEFPGMFRSGQQEYVIWYNTDHVSGDEIPNDDIFRFLEPQWRDRLVSTPSDFFGGFSYIALKHGEQEAIDFARALIDEQNIALVSAAEPLLLSGERPVMFPNFSVPAALLQGAPIAGLPYDGMGVFNHLTGVLESAESPNLAKAYLLWNTFDPDWLDLQFEDPRFEIPQPYTGLPGFVERNPRNALGLEGLQRGFATYLTPEILDERGRLVGVFQQMVTGN